MLRTVYLALFIGLAVFYYYFMGAGPTPSEFGELEWWRPRGWVLRWESLAGLKALTEETGAARLFPVALFALPPLLLMGFSLRRFRHPVVRVFLLALGLTVASFSYYGFLGEGVWRFFSWRWPAVSFCMALVLSALLLAPSLFRWALGLSTAGRIAAIGIGAIAIYLPSVQITGTDWELRANLSPWPVITMFGFLFFGYLAAAIHGSVGLGRVIRARLSGPGATAIGILAAALGSAACVLLLLSEPTPRSAIVLGLLGAFGAAWVLLRQGEPRETAYFGWTQVAAAGFLVTMIFLSDEAANRDLVVARNEVAPLIIDACEAHLQAKDEYPDQLEDIVPEFLEEIPRPKIGLVAREGDTFLYTNLGDSYILEFACAKWIQCAYNPPYRPGLFWGGEDPNQPDDPTPDVAAGGEAEEVLEGSWSCDPTRPKLW
jgi:hypothetical protein